MEFSNISKTEYNRDCTETMLREIFEPEKYISAKQQIAGFPNVKIKIKEIIENIICPKEVTSKEEINDKFLDLDFGSEFDINADKIGIQDAIFFVNLLNQENMINYSVEDGKINLSTDDGKEIKATNSLLSMIQTSYDTKKPIRLDFDRDVTVILRLDKEGKIQAHFIPGTSEVESYLKNNIQCLKQRFDEEEINYSSLGYSKYKENNESKNKKKEQ